MVGGPTGQGYRNDVVLIGYKVGFDKRKDVKLELID